MGAKMRSNLIGCYMSVLMRNQILQNLISLAGMVTGRRRHKITPK